MELYLEPFPETLFNLGSQTFAAIQRQADSFFAAAASRKAALASVADFETYRSEKRAQFLTSVGGLPAARTPLNVQVTGSCQRDGYRLDKLIYESQPGFRVTSLLYVPEPAATAKLPAILFLCGHAVQGKGYDFYQRVQIELARAGFVVLAMDPLGQGDRVQLMNCATGAPRSGRCVTEHIQLGSQCLLAGSNIARYMIWDMIRSVDLLCGLDYVDAARIGVTGNSGGGTQTSYLMIADDRLAAAVPCTYINTRETYLNTGQPQDNEQSLFASIRDGVDQDDYLTSMAPKPVLIGAARYDFFPLHGTLEAYERARRIYRLFAADEAIGLAVGDHIHQYSQQLREAAVNWFRRWLLAQPEPIATRADADIAVEPPEVYSCCTEPSVVCAFADTRTVSDLNRDYLARTRHATPNCEPETVAAVLGLTALMSRRGPTCPIIYEDAGTASVYGIIRERVHFYAEERIILTALQYRHSGVTAPSAARLIVAEEGLSDGRLVEPEVVRALAAGNVVLVMDVRGVGAGQTHEINPNGRRSFVGTEFTLASDYWMMGESLFGRRVFDVLRAVDYLGEQSCVDNDRITVYGCDYGALYALFAAALEPRLSGGTLVRMLRAYADIIVRDDYHLPVSSRILVHGLLQHFDIPDLQARLGAAFSYPEPLVL